MRLYLFVINGEPGARLDLHRAQAALEDHLRDRRDVSDVWWNDVNPFTPRVYLYGGSHSDYEAAQAAGVDAMDADISWEEQGQLIWPVEVPDIHEDGGARIDQPGVKMSLEVVTRDRKYAVHHVESDHVWDTAAVGQAAILSMFATDAADNLARYMNKTREGS